MLFQHNRYSFHLQNNDILQACDSEEDGLFSFDVHSDGEGRRYVLFISYEQTFFSCEEGE